MQKVLKEKNLNIPKIIKMKICNYFDEYLLKNVSKYKKIIPYRASF